MLGLLPECNGTLEDLQKKQACTATGCVRALGRLDRSLTAAAAADRQAQAAASAPAPAPPTPPEVPVTAGQESQPDRPGRTLTDGTLSAQQPNLTASAVTAPEPAPQNSPNASAWVFPDAQNSPSSLGSLTRPQRVFFSGAHDGGLEALAADANATARPGFKYARLDARLHDGDEVRFVTVHNTWLAAINGTPPAFAGRVMLRGGPDNKLCTVSQLGSMSCTAPGGGPREEVQVVETYPGHVALKTASGRFCEDREEGVICTMEMDKSQLESGGWHAFEVVDLESYGMVALRGGRSGDFCESQGGLLTCDAKNVTAATTFHFTRYGVKPGATVVQTRNTSLATIFVIKRASLESNLVAVLCKEAGLYLDVDPESGELKCASQEPVEFDYSRVPWWEPTQGSLMWPGTQKFIQAWDGTTVVRADGGSVVGWSLLTVVLLGGYENVRPLMRGVNLGNWFVVEKWMSDDLFLNTDGQPFPDHCKALDEYGLMESLGPEAAKERMEKHWDTWISKEDIAWIADHGLNAVRVPVGYWMVFPTPPFVEGQFKYLERLFQWCEEYNIAVLLDFHGLKGSQQGQDTSGNCGACMHSECPGETWINFLGADELKTNLAVIDNLTAHFSSSPVYMGFEIANENAAEAYGRDLSNDTLTFYQAAYNLIRSRSQTAMVLIYETFQPSTYPFPNFDDVMTDTHIYFWRFGHAGRNNLVNMENARSILPSESRWPILVGEWSLSATGSAESLGANRDVVENQESFARAQLQVYEQRAQGWFYWTYKTQYSGSLWNFRDQCEQGNLPGCSEKFAYAKAEWWQAAPETYTYLDSFYTRARKDD